jgi:membrane fusion protein, heavy metal efflux system
MNENSNSLPLQPSPEPQGPANPPDSPGRKKTFLARLAGALPTACVLVLLAALAYWGHHLGWALPTFASLTGKEAKENDDWCEAHGVPESQCVECNPALLPRGQEFGWCKTHGVSECPWEHPEVAQLAGKQYVAQTDLDRARRALDLLPRTENNSKCKSHQRRLQFASAEAADKAGIDTISVYKGRMIESVSAPGEITYDQTRVARLSARAAGAAWRVVKQVGDSVRRGEVLALVDAAEVGKAKAEFLQALAQHGLKQGTFERYRDLFPRGALPEQTYREGELALREAEIRLQTAEQALINLGLPIRAEEVKELGPDEVRRRVQLLGLPEDVARTLDPRTTTANLLPVTSPLEGVVVAREVVAGEVVEPAKVLFVVADVSRMWLTLSLRQEDANRVMLGQTVHFRPDGADEVQGSIAWISTGVDDKTRTLKARVDLANPNDRLRANTFGQGQIILREEQETMLVPKEAVHWEGDCHVVFVRDKNYMAKDAPKVFHVRTVRVGASDAHDVEIIAGLLPGEVVTVKGGGTLLAELLKNNLGEG